MDGQRRHGHIIVHVDLIVKRHIEQARHVPTVEDGVRACIIFPVLRHAHVNIEACVRACMRACDSKDQVSVCGCAVERLSGCAVLIIGYGYEKGNSERRKRGHTVTPSQCRLEKKVPAVKAHTRSGKWNCTTSSEELSRMYVVPAK